MNWEKDTVSKDFFQKKMDLSKEEIDDEVVERYFEEIELNFEEE